VSFVTLPKIVSSASMSPMAPKLTFMMGTVMLNVLKLVFKTILRIIVTGVRLNVKTVSLIRLFVPNASQKEDTNLSFTKMHVITTVLMDLLRTTIPMNARVRLRDFL
jgi:hypothetical protein